MANKKLKTEKLQIFVSYISIYIISILLYKFILLANFSYYEIFKWNFNFMKFIISIYLIFLISLILPTKYKKPSDILLHIHFIFPILFMLVLFTVQNLSFFYILITVLCFVIIILIVEKIKVPFFKLKISLENIKIIISFFLIISFLFLIYSFHKLKPYFNLNIYKVYDFRYLIKSNTPSYISYIYNITLKAILYPYLLYKFAISRNKIKKLFYFFIITIIGVISFGFTSQKSLLFLPVSMIILYKLLEKIYFISKLLLFFTVFLTLLFIVANFKSELTLLIISLTFRRTFIIPAQLNFLYFDFFSKHEFTYFTDSSFLPFKYILGYNYYLSIPNVIGLHYFNNPEMSANTGWIGSGFAHMGIIGMLIYAFIIAFILKYLNYLSKYISKNIIVSTFCVYVVVLFLSSDLKTTFLTHGLIIYLIIITLIAYTNHKKLIIENRRLRNG